MEHSKKCFNLDWLEVFCVEDGIKNASYYKQLGWNVSEREYGTPLYREMFTLCNQNGKPFLEIRRNPYSLKCNGGIFENGSCHIRLANRTLYTWNPIGQLQDFLVKYGYQMKGITRIDICCDLLVYDNGMNPGEFISNYMSGAILKNRNSRVNAHGTEQADGRNWNSIKWGSEKSPLSTKIYNKTLELQQASDKLYIKDCWVRNGLCDLQKVVYEYKDKKTGIVEKRTKMAVVRPGTKTEEERTIEECDLIQIWRTEFSIKSEARHWITIDKQHTLDISLTKFQSPERCMLMFILLSKWCMNFVKAEYNENGQQIRKDRCTQIELFSQRNIEKTFKPHRITENEDPTRTEKIIYNRLLRMSQGRGYKLQESTQQLCLQLATSLAASHGNYWISDEHLERMKILREELEKEHELEILAVDSFEALDWVEKWQNRTLSASERSYIKRYKKQHVALFLKRAKAEMAKAEQMYRHARTEIKFWSGETMPPEVKEIIYELPF